MIKETEKEKSNILNNKDIFVEEDISESLNEPKKPTKSGVDDAIEIFARIGKSRGYQIFFVVLLTATFAISGIYGLIANQDGVLFSKDIVTKSSKYPSDNILNLASGFYAYNTTINSLSTSGDVSVLEVRSTLVNSTRVYSNTITVEIKLINDNRAVVAVKRVLYNVMVAPNSKLDISVVFNNIPNRAHVINANVRVIASS